MSASREDIEVGKTGVTERVALAAAFAVAVALVGVYVLLGRIDSDEPQHLHVAWSWTRGLVEYRDIFHNQAPLFHMLMAPVAALSGERANIVILMRLANLTSYLLAILAAFFLSRALFTGSAPLWTAAILAAFPTFVKYGVQFRPDALWTALFLFAVWIMVTRELTWKSALAAGLVLGVAAGFSLKTAALIVAIAFAAALLPLASPLLRSSYSPKGAARAAMAFVAGLAFAPAALVVIFARLGALKPLLYCLFEHNAVAGVGRWSHPGQWLLLLLVVAATVIAARLADGAVRKTGSDGKTAFLILIAGGYISLMLLAPFTRPQTALPVIALLVVIAVGLVAERLRAISARRDTGVPVKLLLWLPLSVVVAEVTLAILIWPPWKTNVADVRRLLSDVIRLTGPDDYVMDAKGETVFRPRPYYYAIERMTTERLKRGLMADDIAVHLVDTRTCVVGGLLPRLPSDALSFIRSNYVPVGDVLVAGQVLSTGFSGGVGNVSFTVRIPAVYAVVSQGHPAAGRLDGTKYSEPRFLDTGEHTWECDAPSEKVVLVWARALERGFTPDESAAPSL